MRPPKGKVENIEIVETAPHEFLLEPNHVFKEIRGTKYYEHGSETLLSISKQVHEAYPLMSWGARSSHDHGSLLVTSMFTSVKYNSGDILVFIESKKAEWRKLGYHISTVPPKAPTGGRKRKKLPEDRHNLKTSTKPSVIFAFVGSNTQDTRMALAKSLVDAGLITFDEVSANGITVGWWDRKTTTQKEET